MDAKETVVTCPCCQSRLEVDVRSGKVVKWRKPGELDETGKPKMRESDWESASSRVSGRMDAAKDRFDASLTKEKNREKDLDDLFSKAEEKLKRRGEDE